MFSILYQLFFRKKKQAQFMYRNDTTVLINFLHGKNVSFVLQDHGAVVPQIKE
jgi:hypothetical protein